MLLPLKVDVAPLACRDDLVDMGFRPFADLSEAPRASRRPTISAVQRSPIRLRATLLGQLGK
jgi:hypothetical protein